MKTKRVVVGAVAAAMLSLSVCSLAPVMAADETVQISVGTATAEPGATFSVDVSLADIPATGLQGCECAIEYDSSLITIDSVVAGSLTDTGADDLDATASTVSIFDSSINNEDGVVRLVWSTLLTDSSYWLNGEGVFCTISGTVASDAENGTTAELNVEPIKYETYPGSGVINTVFKAGYTGSDGKPVNYAVETVDGAVNIGSSSGLKGDANCNNSVEIADAVFILQGIADPGNEDYKLSAQGAINADIDGNGVDAEDALNIQRFKADIIPSL